MKLYAVKSSAVRAAKAAGLTQYEIIEQNGQFGFSPIEPKVVERPKANKQPAAKAGKSKRATTKKTTPVVNVSTIESPVRHVWDVADSMKGAKRKDVIAACVEQGVAFYTARTQYQKWRQNQAT